MTIQPTGTRIYLGIKPLENVGDLNVTGKKTIQEWGKVEAIGPGVTTVNVGDMLLFKAWALDSITYEKQEYFFVDESSGGICAVIK